MWQSTVKNLVLLLTCQLYFNSVLCSSTRSPRSSCHLDDVVYHQYPHTHNSNCLTSATEAVVPVGSDAAATVSSSSSTSNLPGHSEQNSELFEELVVDAQPSSSSSRQQAKSSSSTLASSSSKFRVKKASRKSLDRIKRLINQQTQKFFDLVGHLSEFSFRENEQHASVLDDELIFERKDPNSRAHHDELSVNDPDEYFQGDVDLSEKQAEILGDVLQETIGHYSTSKNKDSDDDNNVKENEDSFESKTRKKRKVGREPLYVRWSTHRPISYDFADSIPLSTRHKIRAAIALWEERTCIRFQENGPSVDRIEFFDGGGCSSFVGKTGGTQGISIATPGCDVVGIISHEIGHALGIFHEQARPDQNGYIFVNYNNIPIARWNNFHPVSINQASTFNLPYDTGSVMHYGAYGFATDPYIPTITTRDKFQQYTIGQRQGPSFLDFAAINIAYHCTDRCPYMYCEHDGYPNPNDCSECLCPDGFAGRICQFVQYTPCGALIMASKNAVFIASPNYPNQHPSESHCIWLLKAPIGHKVMLKFVETFQMLCEDTCDKTYVELKNNGDFRVTGYRFCCSKKPDQIFESTTNEMVVIFRSRIYSGIGFKAKVWSDAEDNSSVEVKSTKPTDSPPKMITISARMTTPTESPPEFTTENAGRRIATFIVGPSITAPPSLISSPSPSTGSLLTPVSPSTIRLTPTTPVMPTTIEEKLSGASSSTPSILEKISSTTTETVPTTPTLTSTPFVQVGGVTSESTMKNECNCGQWSEWMGECSQECGGCGKRIRERFCASTQECRTQDKRACNYGACPPGTNFLINNGEFHILWKGCCVGLFRSGEECSALEDSQNPFLRIISSLLSSEDAKAPKPKQQQQQGLNREK
ncbi:unnamed protein product [Anisakis simplex]|uniref:Metalloendopeptidase n=1 Tax=Anisakis simplex TaxID=6269 RepID=A0A0M3JSV1_ANISI|nr:unnamed protein product [Anisakis simplex]